MPVITADKVGVFGILSDSATQESNKYERKVNEISWLVMIHITNHTNYLPPPGKINVKHADRRLPKHYLKCLIRSHMH